MFKNVFNIIIVVIFLVIILSCATTDRVGYPIFNQCRSVLLESSNQPNGEYSEEKWAAYVQAKVFKKMTNPLSVTGGAICNAILSVRKDGCITKLEFDGCSQYSSFANSIHDALIRSSPFPAPPPKTVLDKGIKFVFKQL